MKIILKKRLAIALGVLSLVVYLLWYFYPFLMGEFLIHKSVSIQNHLNVQPVYIKELPVPPLSWENISIDTLSLQLPVSRYTKISGKESDYISFRSDQGSLSLHSLVPFEPLIRIEIEKNLKYPAPFEDMLSVYKALPADLSYLNSRRDNKKVSFFLGLKAKAPFEELLIVDVNAIKAICIILENGKNGFGATIDLYNPNETVLITAVLYGYKDKVALKSDVLNILGGLKMPNQPLHAEKVKKDISTIVNKYNNRTDQNAPE